MSCKACQAASNAVKKINNIVEGNYNLLVKNEEVESIALERKKICVQCPFKVNLIIINKVQYYKCVKCSCPIESKIRATNESCPINKW